MNLMNAPQGFATAFILLSLWGCNGDSVENTTEKPGAATGGSPSSATTTVNNASHQVGGASSAQSKSTTGGASRTNASQSEGGTASKSGSKATSGSTEHGGETASGGAPPATRGSDNGGTQNAAQGGEGHLGGADAGGSPNSGGAGGQAKSGGASAGGVEAGGSGSRSKTGGSSGVEATTTSPGCSASEPLKSGRASLDVSGTKREYILKLPDNYSATKPYKLIFGFHWRGGSANDVATGTTGGGPYYGLEQRANGSAVFVAPEGIDAGFANTNGRDIAFVRAMLSLFESKLCIDPSRIFSTGFSYGGMMSDSIGCELADVFRAIAPMAGGIPSAQHAYSGCNQANNHPIAVWMAHGDNDTVVPIADGKAALAIFLTRNQCQAQTSPVTPSPCVAYQGCASGYPVHFCQFSGGHSTPNFASAAIWDFFNQF